MHDLGFTVGWARPLSWGQLGLSALATIIFAGFGRWLRGVGNSGAVAGAAVCFLLSTCGGGGALAALVSVFILTWMATGLGASRKRKAGTAESSGGRRASQVLANLSVATVAAVGYAIYGRPALALAVATALSEAAADTVSSEIGQATGSNPRLITNWKVVPVGTDGGVTLVGTMAGVMAAVLISAVSGMSGLIPWNWFGIGVAAAVAGMIADSFLGAWLERRKLLNNDLVNFLGTLIAATVALVAAWTRMPG
jgi:uncharacterized protein (TIGR00297 family)